MTPAGVQVSAGRQHLTAAAAIDGAGAYQATGWFGPGHGPDPPFGAIQEVACGTRS